MCDKDADLKKQQDESKMISCKYALNGSHVNLFGLKIWKCTRRLVRRLKTHETTN